MSDQTINAMYSELQSAPHQGGGHISANPDINIEMLVQLRKMYAELQHALERIASGEPNPISIASNALYGTEEEPVDPN